MRRHLSWSLLVLAACQGHANSAVAPTALLLPDSTAVLDAATGAPISTTELLHRAGGADFVLLGEIHDNAAHHQVRGALLTALASHAPAVVFEQFGQSDLPIPAPAAGQAMDSWLDDHGFDRKNWKWPLHEPVVDAALLHGRSLWGSGLSRETLRAVVRHGIGSAPAELRRLVELAPLDSAAQAAVDAELFADHCGKLPATMMAGMRAAQEVRDAAMAQALLRAGAAGPAWLIAGDGHVRLDMGVPRLLRQAAPGKRILTVGLLERGTAEAVPGPATARLYQVIIVTPPAQREDPCLGL